VTALALVVGLRALGSAAVREVRLEQRVDALTAAAIGEPPVAPTDTATLDRRCDVRRRLASSEGVRWTLDRYERTATYGRGALLSADGVATLFPEYERRTWILLDARTARVDRVLVSGLDACPPPASRVSRRCRLVDELERLYLLQGSSRTITSWAETGGLPVPAIPPG
jgi:hypothetical protein